MADVGFIVWGWLARAFQTRKVVEEPERARYVTVVEGADALRDTLVFLLLEVETLSRSLNLQTVPGELELTLSSTRDRIHEVHAAWDSLTGEVRGVLTDRGVEPEFLARLWDATEARPFRNATRARRAVLRHIRDTLELFCDYDYDEATNSTAGC